MSSISKYGDAALSAVGLQNKAFLIAAPAVGIGALSIGVRVTAGAAALGCKGLGKVAEFAGRQDLNTQLENAKENFISVATKSPKFELASAGVLTAVAAGGFGLSKLLAPEPNAIEKFKNFWNDNILPFDTFTNPNSKLMTKLNEGFDHFFKAPATKYDL
jgi:hypothetical protein